MTFETKRLIIRPFVTGDYESWASGYENRLPPQNQFDVGKVERHEKKYFYDLITTLAKYAKEDKIYVFGTFDKVTGEFIGILELIVLMREGVNWGSIGVSVHNQFWRQGYGLEIVQEGLLIAKDFLKIRRLECTIELGNSASVNLFKNLGFKFETTRKEFALVGDKYVDMDVYFLIQNHSHGTTQTTSQKNHPNTHFEG